MRVSIPGSSGPTLPPGGDVSQVLAKVSPEDGDATWVDPVGTIAALRVWEPATIVFTDSFDAGVPAGAPWSTSGSFATLAMSSTPGANKPGFTTALRMTGSSTTHILTLDLDAIAELATKTPLTLKYWWSVTKVSSGPNFTQLDGATNRLTASTAQAGGTTTDWVEVSAAIGSKSNDQIWTLVNGATNNAAYIAGVRVLAATDPYMLNDIITYDSVIYRSTLNNNPNTPTSGIGWDVV